jgi:cytochrome P450
MKDRDEKNIVRGDFIDKLREIAKNPQETVDRKIITAQGIIFFAAGFETTSHTLSTLTYNLAVNPKIQEKVQLFDYHFINFQEQFFFDVGL